MTKRLLSPLLVLMLGGLLVGCGGASDSTSSSSGGAAAAPAEKAPAAFGVDAADASAERVADAQPADATGATGSAATAAKPASVTRLVRTAELTVEVANVTPASAQVRTAALALGGLVSAETTTYPTGVATGTVHPQSVLTLRVPEPLMDQALTKIAAVGHQLSRTTSSKDVTAAIADLDSRVKSQTESITQIRALLGRAAVLKDVVMIEGQLATREADLEALQARQLVLTNQADLATITVTLSTPATIAATRHKTRDAGFLAGLRGGWHAVTATTVVVLTVLGALLPATVLLALVGIPGYVGYRRLHRRSRPAATIPPTLTS